MSAREVIKRNPISKLSALHWALLFILFILIHIPAIHNDSGGTNAYGLLAKSLCRGHLFLSTSDMHFVYGTHILDTGDLILYQGKYYLPYPPFPSLLLMPFLLFNLGGGVNSVLICVLLSCLNIYVIVSIFNRLGIEAKYIFWLTGGFIFGTSYWFVLLSSHHVYGFAEVVSVTAILLTLNELFGKNRSGLVGTFLGMAFLSRQFTIIISLFIVGYLIYRYLNKFKIYNPGIFYRKLFIFSLCIGCSIAIYCMYNYARFGNIFDTGYENIVFIGILKDRVDKYGVFSIHYFFYNIYTYLFKGFNIEFSGTGLLNIKDVDKFGTALLVASPFLVASFKSGWDKLPRIFSWLTIGIIFTGLLFYHNNGMDQINACRFTLDFLPLMLVLTGIGAKNLPFWLLKIFICYSIVLNIVAFSIHFLFHTM